MLDRLVAEHGDRLLFFARAHTGSAADAEDALQDAVLRWWRQAPDDPTHALARLYVCVRCAARDARRIGERRLRRERRIRDESPMLVDPDGDHHRRLVVERALAALPIEQREVVVLRCWSGLEFAAIATVLDENVNTVMSRWRYAAATLRALIPLEERA